MEEETFFIIFPGGDRNKISVTGLTGSMKWEIKDYAVASRREFYDDEEGAVKYAKELAAMHGKEYVGNSDGYLD